MDLEFNHIKNHFLGEAGDGSAGGFGDANADLGGQSAAALPDRGTGGTDTSKTPTVESLTAELEVLRKSHDKLSGDHKHLTEKWNGKLKSERSDAFRKSKPEDEAGTGDGKGDGKSKEVKDGKAVADAGSGQPSPDDDFDERYEEKETQKTFYAHAEKSGASTEESARILADITELRFGNMPHARMLEVAQQLTTGRFHEAILEKAIKEHGEKVRLETIKQLRDDMSKGGGMPLPADKGKEKSAMNSNDARAASSLQRLGA